MNSIAGFIIGCILFSLCLTLFILFQIKRGQQYAARRKKAEQLALRTNPAYAQVIQEDRQYSLEVQKLELEKQKQTFKVVKWQSLKQLKVIAALSDETMLHVLERLIADEYKRIQEQQTQERKPERKPRK